jgi:hypothetical protein
VDDHCTGNDAESVLTSVYLYYCTFHRWFDNLKLYAFIVAGVSIS